MYYDNDVVLVGSDLVDGGNFYIMKAGDYQVINSQIAFIPSVEKSSWTCIVKTISGSIFGNHYSYAGYFCVSNHGHVEVGQLKNRNGNLVSIDLSSSKELMELAQKHNGNLEFTEDSTIEIDKGVSLTITAGNYQVSDNKIFIQNAQFK